MTSALVSAPAGTDSPGAATGSSSSASAPSAGEAPDSKAADPWAAARAPGADGGRVPDRGLRRSYALPLHELAGLAPDAAAGTTFELWAAWEPPVTRGRRVQRLISDAVLERVVPPVTAEGSPTAILSVPAARTADLVFADRWGSLTVAMLD